MRRKAASPGDIATERRAAGATDDAPSATPASASLFAVDNAATKPKARKDAAAKVPGGRGLADQLVRLGIAREQDLVLHLPLRYEDHTKVVALHLLRAGTTVQAEGTIVNAEIRYRPRRQACRNCRRAEASSAPAKGDAQLVLRFFHFYPSMQEVVGARQARARVRRGEGRAFRCRDGASAIQGDRIRRAAAGSPHSRLSDYRGARPGNAAQANCARVGRRPCAHGRNAAGVADRGTSPVEVRRCRALPACAAAAALGAHAAGAGCADTSSLDTAQVRRAGCAATLAQGASQGPCLAPRAGADRHRRADQRAPCAAALQVDTGSGARLARDPVRPRADNAHAAPVAGRCWQWQDGGRRARGIASDRKRAPGRIHGAHRNLGRAALSQAAAMVGRASGEDRMAFRRIARQAAQGGDRGHGERRRNVRSRHPRAVRRRSPAAALGAGDRRRAASLRCRAAVEAARQGDGRSASDDDERHADSAHPGDDVLRRSRRLDVGRDAAWAHAGHHAPRYPEAPARDSRPRAQGVRRRPPSVLGVPADRGIGKARAADGRGAARRINGIAAGMSRRAVARAHEAGREGRGDGRLRRGRRACARRHHRDRSRRRRSQCHADGDRARRAFRSRPVASVARPGGSRGGGQHVLPAVRGAVVGHRQGAPQGRLREQRRFRDRTPGPGHPRPRRIFGREAIGGSVAAVRGS